MATQVEVREGGSDPVVHTVQDSVSDVVIDVNNAIKGGEQFVTLTGEDGKHFSVKAKTVQDIRET